MEKDFLTTTENAGGDYWKQTDCEFHPALERMLNCAILEMHH